MRIQRGFTLIEFVMMIAVSSFLIVGIVLFTRQQVINGVRMRDFVIANNLAKLKMAQMNNTSISLLPIGTTIFPAPEPSFPNFDVERVVSGISSSLRQIKILVDYRGRNFSSPLIQLITYRHVNTTFGDGS